MLIMCLFHCIKACIHSNTVTVHYKAPSVPVLFLCVFAKLHQKEITK